MKKILVPTDFSAHSVNAAKFACHLSAQTNATVTLLHAFHMPMNVSEAPASMMDMEQLSGINKSQLETLEAELKNHAGSSVNISNVCKMGFAVDEILEYSKSENTDLIVMGMHGTTGKLAETLGSITTEVMKKSKEPVMAVPENYHFRKFSKIVVAVGEHFPVSDKNMELLKEFATSFGAEIYCLNVETGGNGIVHIALEEELKGVLGSAGIKYTLEIIQNTEIETGIKNFASDKGADLIVVIPQEYSFWHSLFHKSHTKHLAFQTSIPLMTIHHS